MRKFNDFDFLWHEKLADGLWRVVEDWGGPQKICIYVVEGSEKTIVVDSGCGATHGLRKYIEENITGKRYLPCYMTHTHPDHVGGCTLFDEQYVHPEELPQLTWGLNDKRRIHDAATFAFTGMPGSRCHADLDRAMEIWEYCKENYVPVDPKKVEWKMVRDGDVIDLGDKKLECIYLNAHGSMIYYNREQDYALCGDNLTYTLAVGDVDDELIAKYENLASKLTDKTVFYSGHLYYEDMVTRPQEIDMPMLKQIIQVFKNIVAGVGLDADPREVKNIIPGEPTLAGYQPDPEETEAWESFRAQHPERKGKVPKQGDNYVHMVGPVIITYKK